MISEAMGTVIVAMIATITSIILAFIQKNATEKKIRERLSQAELKVEKEPEKAKPAWDLARVTLESYFNKNLNQVTAIFWLSVFVMLAGFGIIVWGIMQAIQTPTSVLPSIVTGFSGVITELIGATFLFVYRSTMQQALNYTKTLERINSVGMAMQILDTIPEKSEKDNLKESTKALVIKALMQQTFQPIIEE